MKIDINKIGKIARINLSKEEEKEFLPQLEEILDYFSKLKEVKTDKVKASFLPVDKVMQLREDKERKCLSQKEVLAKTNHKEKGFFKGPKII